MKRPILLIPLMAAAVAGLSIPAAAQKKKKPPPNKPISVAVLDFTASGELEGKGGDAAALLTGLLSADDGLIVVERAELAKILGEAELSLSGNVSADTAAKVGQLTGAKVLITGRMFNAGKTNYAVAKVISAETSRVFGETAKFEQGEEFAGAIEILAGRVGKVFSEKADDLIAAVETPEERIKRLKQLVAGKKLPGVFVEITEEHLSARIPDPAAQTEIQKTLQDIGFTLAENSDGADVVITGEAFSETAGRRANLISCRARVEVKIKRKAAEGELLVERQTSMAVDLAENIASKSALQNAGSELAERLVVLLVK